MMYVMYSNELLKAVGLVVSMPIVFIHNMQGTTLSSIPVGLINMTFITMIVLNYISHLQIDCTIDSQGLSQS